MNFTFRIDGLEIQDIIPGTIQNSNEFYSAWGKVLEGTLQRVNLQFISKGASNLVAKVLVPVSDSGGNLVRIVCICIDASEG